MTFWPFFSEIIDFLKNYPSRFGIKGLIDRPGCRKLPCPSSWSLICLGEELYTKEKFFFKFFGIGTKIQYTYCVYFLDNGIRYAYVFSLLLGAIGFVLSFFVWFEEVQREVARVTLVLFNQVGLFQNVFVMSVIVNIL